MSLPVARGASRPHAGSAADELVVVRGVRKHYPIRSGVLPRARGVVRAVDGVDLTIRRGSTLGLVGESGCGKTTLARCILRLAEPTEGSIVMDGLEIARLPERALRALRPRMQIVFQDPTSSLDPRMRVGEIIAEPLRIHGADAKSAEERVAELMRRVGLSMDLAGRAPHELSGGQRQRVGIARALALDPAFVVLDEPTSALDVSVQAQVLNLLARLQREMGLAYLLISHDLSVVRHLCDEVAVMYLGRIVESGPVEDVFRDPQHPYTQALLAAAPVPDPSRRVARTPLAGDVPSPVDPPSGCRFHPRCPRAEADPCARVDPALMRRAGGGRVACHLVPATIREG